MKLKLVKTNKTKIEEFLKEKLNIFYSEIKNIYPIIYYNIIDNPLEFYILSFFNVIDKKSSYAYIVSPFVNYLYEYLTNNRVISKNYSNKQLITYYVEKTLEKYGKNVNLVSIKRKVYILNKNREVYKKYLILNNFKSVNEYKIFHDYILYTILFNYVTKIKKEPLFVYRASDIERGEIIYYDLILANELLLKDKSKQVLLLPIELIRLKDEIEKTNYLRKGNILFFDRFDKNLSKLQHIIDLGSYVVPYQEISNKNKFEVRININQLQTKLDDIMSIANIERVKLNKDLVPFVLLWNKVERIIYMFTFSTSTISTFSIFLFFWVTTFWLIFFGW